MHSTKKVSGQGCSETFVCRGRPRRERDWEKGAALFPARLTKEVFCYENLPPEGRNNPARLDGRLIDRIG